MMINRFVLLVQQMSKTRVFIRHFSSDSNCFNTCKKWKIVFHWSYFSQDVQYNIYAHFQNSTFYSLVHRLSSKKNISALQFTLSIVPFLLHQVLYKSGSGKRFGCVACIDMKPEDELQFQYNSLGGEWGDSDRHKEMDRIKDCLIQVSVMSEDCKSNELPLQQIEHVVFLLETLIISFPL